MPKTTQCFSFEYLAVGGKLAGGAVRAFLSEALLHTDIGSQVHLYFDNFPIVSTLTLTRSESVESLDRDQTQVISSLVFYSTKLALNLLAEWEIFFAYGKWFPIDFNVIEVSNRSLQNFV